ncbi:hypothetical protein OOT33_13125 [Sphingobium sp. DEHP117]|uniref:hypothetical protein n=1 Tax=Sphingobium sp. DEHP117 TaxID=2993436 RepID=UPI0027D70C76|nr:hypothetical protein [Sphingobium sp. DEHP117]MDQ4421365.1 hypothetical protein [Sphingobium sp. DEHP117]
MIKNIFGIILAVSTLSVARAQDPSQLTTMQVAIIYDQCLARAAQRASETEVPPEAIFGIAKAAYSQTRTMLVGDLGPGSEKIVVLDKIDTDREATFPESTRKVREMRRQFEEKWGKRDNAPNQ